jgi:uncharacterized membrane protein YfcA
MARWLGLSLIAYAFSGLAALRLVVLRVAEPVLLAVVVSPAGMRLGQGVRAKLQPQALRLCFFVGLLALGAYLALRGLG